MKPIKIMDMPMGSGKTSFMIDYMNSHQDKKYVFITPYLKEVERIQNSCPQLHFEQPDGKYSKLADLKKLIANGRNIVATHQLFSLIDNEIKNLFSLQDYIFILDEVLEVVQPLQISSKDLNMLIDTNTIYIREDNRVILSDNNYRGKFNKEINKIKNQNVMLVNHTLLLCLFKPEIFDCFEDTFILTYLFENSITENYFTLYHVPFQYCYFKEEEIINSKFDDTPFKERIKKILHIYEGNLNKIGDNKTALSVKWFNSTKKKDEHKILKNNTRNFFLNINKAKSAECMWSCFAGNKEIIKHKMTPKDYAGGFVPCNCRATNEYADRKYVTYMINVFLNPYVTKFFQQNNITVSQENFALSQLLQFVWRSRIRNDEEIELYLPSKRMRNLIINFLK